MHFKKNKVMVVFLLPCEWVFENCHVLVS